METFGNALSADEGESNAFRIRTEEESENGPDSRLIDVSLAYDQQTVGIYDGAVMFDYLDITLEGGISKGAGYGNDFVSLLLRVVNHSNASFDSVADLNALTVNLGEVSLGEPITPVDFSIYNLASQAGVGLTANLDLVAVNPFPQNGFLTFSSSLFEGLNGDNSAGLTIAGTPSQLRAGSTEFVLQLSDEDIPGAEEQFMLLIVNFNAVDNFLLGDINRDGVTDFLDIAPFIGLLTTGTFLDGTDFNGDGQVTFLDIAPFIAILAS